MSSSIRSFDSGSNGAGHVSFWEDFENRFSLSRMLGLDVTRRADASEVYMQTSSH